jgi:two-component system, chemotaxis family, CheB/CheR fusion protein
MVEMLGRTLGEAVEIRTELAPDLRRVKVDPAQLQNALLNLAINARDAMPNGGQLVIETKNLDLDEDTSRNWGDVTPGRYVKVSVSDTGDGIAKELLGHVFEPFFTTKEQGKGTGLGLSMVHGFAKQSGGHAEIHSVPGHGAVVSLYLPDISGSAEAVSGEKEIPEINNECAATVLVVEDDVAVRDITVARLAFLGYSIIEAENAQAALDILAVNRQIDLVLSDVVMPGGMTGVELSERVRKLYPEIKVILASGYAQDGVSRLNAGPWLRKPYSVSELASLLHQMLA